MILFINGIESKEGKRIIHTAKRDVAISELCYDAESLRTQIRKEKEEEFCEFERTTFPRWNFPRNSSEAVSYGRGVVSWKMHKTLL